MGAVAQVADRRIYERTKEVGSMLTSGQLARAIIREINREFARQEPETNIFEVLPARAATNVEYEKGAREAWFWNGGGPKKKLPFPLNDGYYLLGEGAEEFGAPNGEPSNRNNPNALYLSRLQNSNFSGPFGLGVNWVGVRRRYFGAFIDWSDVSGVALIRGRGATAPPVGTLTEKLDTTNPKALLQRAELLEAAAKGLTERLGTLSPEDYARLIKPGLDEAAFLRELAGSVQPKA